MTHTAEELDRNLCACRCANFRAQPAQLELSETVLASNATATVATLSIKATLC